MADEQPPQPPPQTPIPPQQPPPPPSPTDQLLDLIKTCLAAGTIILITILLWLANLFSPSATKKPETPRVDIATGTTELNH